MMIVHIFAESSNTTAEDCDLPIKEYYQGLFGMVAGLDDEFNKIAETRLHVLTEEFGVGDGTEPMSYLTDTRQSPVGFEKMTEDGRRELLDAAPDADVMVILFSTDVFDATVKEEWETLVDAAKPGSVWCLSAARSCLNSIDVEPLESKGCTVLTYQRVGVARIGSETKDELIEVAQQKAAQ